MKDRILKGLILSVSLGALAPAAFAVCPKMKYPQQLIKNCTAGSLKKNCLQNQQVACAEQSSDFTFTYNFTCKRIYSRARPVLYTSQSSYALSEGSSQIVTVRDTNAVYFRFEGDQAHILSSDCSIVLNKPTPTPSDRFLQSRRDEATRLTQLLIVRQQYYSAIKDYDDLIVGNTILQLGAVESGLRQILGLSLDLAFNPPISSEDGPDGPPDEAPFGLSSQSESAKTPADYGLNLPDNDWKKFTDEALTSIFEQEPVTIGIGESKITVNGYAVKDPQWLPAWYTDAKDTYSFITQIVKQLLNTKNAALIKEGAKDANYELPRLENVKNELVATLKLANEFITENKAIQSHILSQYNELNQKSHETKCELKLFTQKELEEGLDKTCKASEQN